MNAARGDPSLCPRCQQPNNCGIVVGSADGWCFATSIPPDKRCVIGRDASEDVCLCGVCLSELGMPAVALKTMCEVIRRWR